MQATHILQTWNLSKSVAMPRPDTVTKGVTGFYLGFTIRMRSPEWPRTTSFLGGSWGMPPPELF